MKILSFNDYSRLVETQDVWTDELKQKAVEFLSNEETENMGKKIKVLMKNVKFLSNGTARYSGKAHDYTIDPSDLE
jgi:hypothetical protein